MDTPRHLTPRTASPTDDMAPSR